MSNRTENIVLRLRARMTLLRKTLRYMSSSLMSNIGPSTIKAICALSGKDQRKLAAIKASASLHRLRRMAQAIIRRMASHGEARRPSKVDRETELRRTAAMKVPITR